MAKAVWSAAEIAEERDIRRRRQLFEGQHEAYFVLPSGQERRYDYVTVNWLGDVLSQTYTRLLFRECPQVQAEGDPAQGAAVARLVEELGLPRLCLPSALMVSYAGRAVWKLYWSQLRRAPVVRLWGARDGEFVTFETLPGDPSTALAVNFWYDLALAEGRAVKVRERHALLLDARDGAVAGVRLTNAAYAVEHGVPVGAPLSLDRLWPDPATQPPAEEILEGLPLLPVVTIHNSDRSGDLRGDSDYTPSLISLQRNLNKLVAVRQMVIDLSEQPQLLVPPEYVDAQGNIDWNSVRLRIKYEGEPAAEIRAINWSGNLENSGKQWDAYRREFLALTGIAPALFGDAHGLGGESGYARRLGMIATEAEVGVRRHAWETAFNETLCRAMWLERLYGGSAVLPVPRVSVTWPQAIPDDPAVVSATALAEYAAGARSLPSTVRRLNPAWTAEDLAAELAQLGGRSVT